MNVLLIIGIAIGAIVAGFVAAVFLNKNKTTKKNDWENIFAKLSQDALKSNTEQFLTLAKEVLGSQKNEIKTDLQGKKDAINELINEIRKDIKKNEERLSKSDEERVHSFSALSNELKTYKEITGDLKVSTDRLKELLSNNQMRGAFGEQIADNLLKMAGFVVGQDYSKNETQDAHGTRPDFTIFLPDRTKINIDVKFPYSSLVKYVGTDEKTEKERHLRNFKTDVKNKIKQVSSREYINPEEKTVDFVILFIPNEMIFSFIYDKMNEIWEEAMEKKVVLTGPFSFTAILRMIKQAYANFRYQENLHHIIGLIHRFDSEYQKYSDSVDLLGDRLTSTLKQYEIVSTTRNRQLTAVVDKIRNQNILPATEKPDKLIE